MTTTFETINSTYEVDRANKQIRRLQGVRDPTPRQGEDGNWKTYESISDIVIGDLVLVTWYTDENRIGKSTLTTNVIGVTEDATRPGAPTPSR